MQNPNPIEITVTSDDLLSVDDAARLLNIHRATLYRWIKQGKIAYFTIATSTFIPKSEIGRLQHGAHLDKTPL